MAGAPDEKWATTIPRLRGSIEKQIFKSTILNDRRDIWIYTAPDYVPDKGPYPFLLPLQGAMHVVSGVGPTVIDNLIEEGNIRPPVVCFIQQGAGVLTNRFAEAVSTELIPQLRSTYRISTKAEDIVIGGFSAGALDAAYIALKYSNVFGNVLSQSGAFRARFPGASEPNSLSAMYIKAPRLPLRFHIETGLYEPFPAATRPIDEAALDESNTGGNRHFRDVLLAKGYDVRYRETAGAHQQLHWRATLADALMALLPPQSH